MFDPASPKALALLTLALCGGAHSTRATREDIAQVFVKTYGYSNETADETAKRALNELAAEGYLWFGDVIPGQGIMPDRQYLELTISGAKEAAVALFRSARTCGCSRHSGRVP